MASQTRICTQEWTSLVRATSKSIAGLLILMAWWLLGVATAAGESKGWVWRVVEPRQGEIATMAGNAIVIAEKKSVRAILNQSEPGLDPFHLEIRVLEKGGVRGALTWPHSDLPGPVALNGRWVKWRSPAGEIQETVWMVDQMSGIYVVLTR